MSGANDARSCYNCKALCRKGSRCPQCRWPDPEAQPKQHVAWLRRYIHNAERAAKKAGIDTSKIGVGDAMKKLKALK
jgi:hypothetical protein